MKSQQDFLNDAFQESISTAGKVAALGFLFHAVTLRALKDKGVFTPAETEALLDEVFTSCPPVVAAAGEEMRTIALALLREPSGR